MDNQHIIACIREAKERLRGHWWQSTDEVTETGQHCAATACVKSGYDVALAAIKELIVTLTGTASPGNHVLYAWNDQPERIEADVLDLYDRTIARLEAQT